ncbi:MAG: hypothetical protein M3N00_03405, partial [Actinomycetota bacterium]|nr:hypothetical protein [Actinomycetota bacterium]
MRGVGGEGKGGDTDADTMFITHISEKVKVDWWRDLLGVAGFASTCGWWGGARLSPVLHGGVQIGEDVGGALEV